VCVFVFQVEGPPPGEVLIGYQPTHVVCQCGTARWKYDTFVRSNCPFCRCMDTHKHVQAHTTHTHTHTHSTDAYIYIHRYIIMHTPNTHTRTCTHMYKHIQTHINNAHTEAHTHTHTEALWSEDLGCGHFCLSAMHCFVSDRFWSRVDPGACIHTVASCHSNFVPTTNWRLLVPLRDSLFVLQLSYNGVA